MKNRFSAFSCLIVCAALLVARVCSLGLDDPKRKFTVTQWDAFGYYLYAPAVLIYHDYKKLDWMDSVDKRYNVSGGGQMPVVGLENGNKVGKYFCGVSIMQLPLFVGAHVFAKAAGYPADGFSPPYEYALAFGVVLYCMLALLLLRRILLLYFTDTVAALSIILLCVASNFIQYAAVDNGLSHAYIFPLYVLVLFATIKWHERPGAFRALALGFIIGLATICRPTEAVMLFIPLLWGTQYKTAAKEKWALVRRNRFHVLCALGGGVLGILPQLIYWKLVTGSFVYDVGSKWVFLNPWWRVLVGWEKGWFIYTPAAILFVVGLFFIRRYSFRYAALVFCLLNIWIVISWDEWQYGASYSTRALVQSYPVFALPLGALITKIMGTRWRYVLYVLCIYLPLVNLFQVWQYNRGIIHYNDMNRRYYQHIYLNPRPSSAVMSLLDTQEWPGDESYFRKRSLLHDTGTRALHFKGGETVALDSLALNGMAGKWLRLDVHLKPSFTTWKSSFTTTLNAAGTTKTVRIRLSNPVGAASGTYAWYFHIPAESRSGQLRLSITSEFDFEGIVDQVAVTVMNK